jgi:hypothetical protein
MLLDGEIKRDDIPKRRSTGFVANRRMSYAAVKRPVSRKTRKKTVSCSDDGQLEADPRLAREVDEPE